MVIAVSSLANFRMECSKAVSLNEGGMLVVLPYIAEMVLVTGLNKITASQLLLLFCKFCNRVCG